MINMIVIIVDISIDFLPLDNIDIIIYALAIITIENIITTDVNYNPAVRP